MKRSKVVLPLVVLAVISTCLAAPIKTYADTHREEQSGFPDAGGTEPDSISGIFDNKQNTIDNSANNETQNNDCKVNVIVSGKFGIDDFGKGSSGSSGDSMTWEPESGETFTSFVEISGTVTGEDTYNQVVTVQPGGEQTVTVTKPTTETITVPTTNTTTVPTTNPTQTTTQSSTTSKVDSLEDENPDDLEQKNIASIEDLSNLTATSKLEIIKAENLFQLEQGNENALDAAIGLNNTTQNMLNPNSILLNGKKYGIVTMDEFANATIIGENTFEIQTSTGNTIYIELQRIPGSKEEWAVKSYEIFHEEDNDEGWWEDGDWTLDKVELLYGYWEWKNVTNTKWKEAYGDHYYPVGGSSSKAKTPGKTSIAWSLGHGPYDNGTWSVKMTPVMKETYVRWSDKREKEVKSVREPVYYEPTYYTVTVPLVCETCPEIIMCLGDDPNCDCGDLNTKCDDVTEPELEISLRSELEK